MNHAKSFLIVRKYLGSTKGQVQLIVDEGLLWINPTHSLLRGKAVMLVEYEGQEWL